MNGAQSILASVPTAAPVRAMFVAQLPADGLGRHVPLLARRAPCSYRPDFIPTCPNTLSQEPRVVGVLKRGSS